MLQELTIRNFALLEVAQLQFGSGLIVLTGETGAGKSIIIDAIGSVLGGRVSSEVVRAGTERASVEAIFALTPAIRESVRPVLDHLELTDVLDQMDEPSHIGDTTTLVLGREIGRNGRSIARLNGRAVPASVLAQIGAFLVDIHGQHDHLSLLRADAQRDILDRFGGHSEMRRTVARLWHSLATARATRQSMHTDEREVARRLDMLSFQVDEITQASLVEHEDVALLRERARLNNAGRLTELAQAVLGRLGGDGGDGEVPARDHIARALRDLDALARIDAELDNASITLAETSTLLDDVIRTMSDYLDRIEFNPARQADVEQRLDLIRSLQHKYGASIADVLAYATHAQAEIDLLVTRDARTATLDVEITALEQTLGTEVAALSQARTLAGERLAQALAAELRALSLKGAFEALVHQSPDREGVPVGTSGTRLRCDTSGVDTVAFHFAPNPGEPSRPIARTASGGELSRILLALKSVLSRVDRTPTLIFDEIDTGVGGRNAQVLGEKLAGIGGDHQVFCITHLPQVAAYGDGHWFLAKGVVDGRTTTVATALDDDGRIKELAQMLGGQTVATLAQATELIDRASIWKRTTRIHGASDAA